MRTNQTCNTCTIIRKLPNGKIEITETPDSQCNIRDTCHDDGSTHDRRKENIEQIPT